MPVADHPAALRNREPLLDALRPLLEPGARVLEVASGNGTHVQYFARALPAVSWQPSEPNPSARAELDLRLREAPLQNVAAALPLDVRVLPWGLERVDLVLAINLIHVSDIETLDALTRGAAATLERGGRLVLYGPFKEGGAHTSDGNRRFDAMLRQENADWGIRDVAEVVEAAARAGLRLERRLPMPANNLTLVFVLAPGILMRLLAAFLKGRRNTASRYRNNMKPRRSPLHRSSCRRFCWY